MTNGQEDKNCKQFLTIDKNEKIDIELLCGIMAGVLKEEQGITDTYDLCTKKLAGLPICSAYTLATKPLLVTDAFRYRLMGKRWLEILVTPENAPDQRTEVVRRIWFNLSRVLTGMTWAQAIDMYQDTVENKPIGHDTL